MPPVKILKEGFLFKKESRGLGGLLGSLFVKKYFVLKGHTLYIYEDRSSAGVGHSGMFSLLNCVSVEEDRGNKETRGNDWRGMKLTDGSNNVLTLFCESSKFETWKDVVSKVQQDCNAVSKARLFAPKKASTQKSVIEGYVFIPPLVDGIWDTTDMSWNKRYCKLFDNRVEIFSRQSSSSVLHCLRLTPDFYVGDSRIRENAFIVSDFEETYYLGCASSAEKLFWMQTVAKILRTLEREHENESKDDSVVVTETVQPSVPMDPPKPVFEPRVPATTRGKPPPPPIPAWRKGKGTHEREKSYDAKRNRISVKRKERAVNLKKKVNGLSQHQEERRNAGEARGQQHWQEKKKEIRKQSYADDALAKAEAAARAQTEKRNAALLKFQQAKLAFQKKEEAEKTNRLKRISEDRRAEAEARRKRASLERREQEQRREQELQFERERARKSLERMQLRRKMSEERREREEQARLQRKYSEERRAKQRETEERERLRRRKLSEERREREEQERLRRRKMSNERREREEQERLRRRRLSDERRSREAEEQRKREEVAAKNKKRQESIERRKRLAAEKESKNVVAKAPVAKKKNKLADRVNLWNKKVDTHTGTQATNPFSAGGGSKIATAVRKKPGDDGYGTAKAGTKTAQRAAQAKQWVEKEVEKLIGVISEIGYKQSDGKTAVKFGTLFVAYQDISDTLVGILMRAKKRNRLHYKGDMLFQGCHDNVEIVLTS